MKNISMKYIPLLAGLLFCTMPISQAMADDDDDDDNSDNCVDGYLDQADVEFGLGSAAVTRCLDKVEKVKVVYQLNQTYKRNIKGVPLIGDVPKKGDPAKPYGLGNIMNALNDYENTHGMVIGEDFEVVVVIHGAGWPLMMNNLNTIIGTDINPFLGHPKFGVAALLDRGVKFYLCQNTARKALFASKGIKIQLTDLIDGVEFVPSGVTAVADFQIEGYAYVQP